jgi:hypothetical protein
VLGKKNAKATVQQLMLEASSVESLNWQDVPDEHWTAWTRTFGNSRDSSLDLSDPCPVCQSKTLHRWYMIGQQPRDLFISKYGVKSHASGALWEWCSMCGSYAHYSARVPDFWSPPSDFHVDTSKLRTLPWIIEDARQEWVKQHQPTNASST